MYLTLVDHQHYVSLWDTTHLPEDANHWGYRWYDHLEASDYAVIATDGTNLVGFFRFDMGGTTMQACGTWVAKTHRKQGLGSQMWSHAIQKAAPRKIWVATLTQEGTLLVDSVRSAHPGLEIVTFRHQGAASA